MDSTTIGRLYHIHVAAAETLTLCTSVVHGLQNCRVHLNSAIDLCSSRKHRGRKKNQTNQSPCRDISIHSLIPPSLPHSNYLLSQSKKSKGCKNWLPVRTEKNKFQQYWQQPNRKAIARHLIIEDIDQRSDLSAVVWLKGLIEPQCSVKWLLFVHLLLIRVHDKLNPWKNYMQCTLP